MKKIKVIVFALLLIISFTGCSQADNEEEGQDIAEDSMNKDIEKAEQTEEINSASDEITPSNVSVQKILVEIYYANDTADGLFCEESEVDEVTPEILIEKLAEKGMIDSEVEVLNCKQYTVEDEKVIDLDLSEDFSVMLRNYGTAGESMIIHSVVNTFLKTYDCQKICITVEGGVLETGHAEYSGYMTLFEE